MSQTAASITTFDVREAETQLLQLLALALRDGEVIITNDNIPLAQLVPVKTKQKRRIAGLHKGAMRMHADFNEPLSDVFGMDAT